MGQFQDQLNNIIKIESNGFNPMTESYSARIGQLPTTDPTITDPTLTADQITKGFTDQGYEDPIATLVNTDGTLDLNTLNSAYDRASNIPGINVSGEAFIDYLNTNEPTALSKTYFPDAQIEINKNKTLGFPSNEKPKADPSYRFEKTYNNATNKDVYQRFDSQTGESISYDTKGAYDKAIEEYKSITGVNPTTGKKDPL
jgi:hypothetical protein